MKTVSKSAQLCQNSEQIGTIVHENSLKFGTIVHENSLKFGTIVHENSLKFGTIVPKFRTNSVTSAQ